MSITCLPPSHSPCPPCSRRYSLSEEVIAYIHSNRCINLYLGNIRNAIKQQPPLELVEMIATIFCCLKDSSDFSQVLLDDFSASQGYNLLYSYLLFLEACPFPDASDAMRNLVLLIQNLIMDGFHSLDIPSGMNFGGPFQDSKFTVPTPNNQGSTVRNIDAFLTLNEAFLNSRTKKLCLTILETFLNVFKSDSANYFIVASHHPLPTLLEKITEKDEAVQDALLKLVDHVILEIHYIPTAEMTGIGLLLEKKEYPGTMSLVLNFLLRLISYQSRFKSVYREVGILTMLINTLKTYASDLEEKYRLEKDNSGLSDSQVISSPSLPVENIQGETDECMFLLMECIRATIEGVEQNGEVFRENKGTSCTLSLIRYSTPRRMALKVMRQLILLEDGSVDFNSLLDQLIQTPQTFVNIKSEILYTVLGVFQLDSGKKAVFREVSGFHYLISLLASLIGSLAPRRVPPWDKVSRADVLQLVQLIFITITAAMQEDAANRHFFENDIRYDSFTAPLLLLGCFSKNSTHIIEATPTNLRSDSSHRGLQTSGSFSNFEAEFKTWQAPEELLDEDSFVFCAAELFRYLRDMAVEVTSPISPSLLNSTSSVGSKTMRRRDKNFYGAPPITSKSKGGPLGGGSGTPNLIHPGAILCMVDLLPSVRFPEENGFGSGMASPDNVFESRSNSRAQSRESTPFVLSSPPPGFSKDDTSLAPPTEHVNSESTSASARSMSASVESEAFFDAKLEQNSEEKIQLEPEAVPGGTEPDGNVLEPAQVEEVDILIEHVGVCEKGGVAKDEQSTTGEGSVIEEVTMEKELAVKWCVFLQERVVSEVFTLAVTERNQQALCQVGLPQHILSRCPGVLADETHPLHHALERTFEKLSYQALTSSDFRSFLRLGSPLSCSLSTVTPDDLRAGKYDAFLGESSGTGDQDQVTNHNAPFGGSLSLARIQSLVTMTTSRDGCQSLVAGAPPFIEFDLSVDGFGCLFLPSVFPFLEPSALQNTPAVTTGGVGGGDRIFPPTGGLSFTTWVLVNRFSTDEPAPHLTLLCLSHTICSKSKKLNHLPCLVIYLKPAQHKLFVSSHFPQDVLLEDIAGHNDDSAWRKSDTIFHCPEVFQSQSWNHIAVAMVKPGLRGRAKVTLFVNGRVIGTQKMHPIQAVHASPLSNHFSDSSSILINAHIGTHLNQRHVSLLTYRLGPTFLFEEHLSLNVVSSMFKLGPSYIGSFQAPVLHDAASVVPVHSSSSVPPPLVSEEKVLFGVIATHPQVKTASDLDKLYNPLDVSTIRKELSLSESDDVTPVTLVHNTAVHLPGSSRTLGAVLCGYSGIRFFQPQPLRTLLSSVGGTQVVLGLVAMATTVDSLYASMKALVCIVGNNPVALKEMERTGGFKVLGMLLRSKSHLVNSNILHLTYTLVGTVDSEQESSAIPNLIAFKDLLADFAVWSKTSEDIQRSLFNHLFELLSHMSHKLANAEHMLQMKMTSFLLYRLLDNSLTIRTIKKICNVISALLGIIPQSEDLIRLGQLLATTLPSNRNINENTIDIYYDDETQPPTIVGLSPSQQTQFGRFRGDENKQRRAIVLRNVLFDVLISLLTRNMELNSQFARELYHSLGFDWLFLFMNATIHTETVVRAVRVLVQMLCDPALRQSFINGDIFGGWVKDFEFISEELSSLIRSALSQHNPFQRSQLQQVPGPLVLAYLLPCHSDLSQVYLLLSATLLGRQCTDISYSAQFDLQTLEEVFHVGVTSVAADYKISGDVASVLLVIARSLLHKDNADPLQQNAVNLIKFFDRLYKSLPQFAALATTPEFIEALVATLFPPVTPLVGTASVSDVEQTGEPSPKSEVTAAPSEGEDWIMIEKDVLPGTDGKEDGDAILSIHDSLAVCTIIKLLRTIAIDGFSSSTPLTKDSAASCPILERILGSTPPGISQSLIRRYQTLLLQSMMEYLQTGGKEDITVIFREGALAANLERSYIGLAVFCSRLVDKVWQHGFLGTSQSIYHFLFWLVEQGRRVPKLLPLFDIQRCLNRVILYEVSHIPTSEDEQRFFMDMLCMFSSQAHLIFDETNIDDQFLECLLFCLLRIVHYEKFLAKNPILVKMDSLGDGKEGGACFVDHTSLQDQLPSGYVPGSLAMMKSGANRLWTKMLEFKKDDLQRLLGVDLPAPSESHRDTLMSSLSSQQVMAGVVYANKTFLRLQNCHLFWTEALEKTWKDFVSEEKSSQALDSAQKDPAGAVALRKGVGLVATVASRVRRKRGTIVNKEDLVNEFVTVYSPLLILASQKYFELLLRKHQRNVEYRLRFAASEWSKVEYELTRERGLWGPEKSSPLEKWMVDPVEGPCRMRKRLCMNRDFYSHYKYRPPSEHPVSKKHTPPSSSDSELQALRERLFQRPTILATPTHLTTAPTIPSVRGKEDSSATATEAPEGVVLTSPIVSTMSTPAKLDIFNHPDSDDPIAQTLFKMIEPDDKVNHRYQCARLTGLDSVEGVLLLGNTHFYVIEGVTITKNDNIVDIESCSEDLYDPVVPGSRRFNERFNERSREKTEVPITCIKLRYDTIREVHKRRYLLRHCAVEVFAHDGRSHFLIFYTKFRDKVCQRLLSQKSSLPQADSHYIAGMHPEMDPEQSHGIFSVLTGERKLVDKWVNGEMTNFQYLMHLNTLAGRSYNDLMQYPVFPWVLADYTSEALDLTDPKSFRDLSKPMGAQGEERLKRFMERYKYFEDPTGEGTPPYYYGTHYSSAMIVASYLIRMESFTQYFLKLQGGHFDLPDRLFHSIPDAWRSASENNMADIKELIPEFFYLPEFLSNTNNFDLGTKQSGEVLGNVVLPPWSKGDPNEFIRTHREALECDYVSANLHKWIDLIFGYKQRGEEALTAHNVFHHLFYEGAVDIDKIDDPMKKMAVISFIHNFGQVPKQLFKRPHRQRKVLSTTLPQDTPSTNTSSSLSSSAQPTATVDADRVFYKNLVQLMPSREPVKVIGGEVVQMVCPSDSKAPLALDRNKLFLPWANYKYYIMWGFPDHSAKVATVDTDKVVAVFEGLHEGRVLCAAVANDNTLLTGGESTVVCVWDIAHGAREKSPVQLHLKHTLHGHNGPVICLATSSSYNLIASGSKDGTCILWDMTSCSFIRQLSGHSIPVTIVTINSLNGNIVTCTRNQIRLWTVNGSLLAETPSVTTSSIKVLSCVMSELFDWNKDNVIVTGSSDGIVRMWRLEYVSEEELQINAKARRGSAADSMFSTGSVGGSAMDIASAREAMASNVISRLRSATLEPPRSRSNSSLNRIDLAMQESQEMFRPTGQGSKGVSSNTSATDVSSASRETFPHEDVDRDVNARRHRRSTFSEDEEEDRTAGSGVDLIANCPLITDSNLAQVESEERVGGSATPTEGKSETDGTVVDVGLKVARKDEKAVDGSDNVADVGGGGGSEVEGQKTSGEGTDVGRDNNKEAGSGDKSDMTEEDKELQELARVNPAYAKYLMERRRQAAEIRQRTGKWERRLKLVHTLTMHTSVHRKDNDRPAAVTCLCISKDHKRLFVGDSRGRVFSWTVSDNLGVMQHWIIDSAVNKCSKCDVEFSFTERKHHCRDCGHIFCAKCSSYEIEVERLRIHRKVRVCNRCYDRIAAERSRHIFRTPADVDHM